MSTKSLKFFGPSTTKWQPWKNFFAKLNGNHLSMVNIFKLCKHQTFGLMKCIIWAKSNLATINSVCVKIGFTINGPSNMLFFNFWLFSFLFFSKGYCQTTGLFNFFEICKEIHFISLFFLNERNIATSLLMAHSKCAILHYANLNSSYINKLLLNYRPLKILFLFFFFNFLFTFI